MSKQKTIKEQCAEWMASVMPGNAPQVQRQEMERAFYSGFVACLDTAMRLAGQGDEDALRTLKARWDEATVYFKTLKQIPSAEGQASRN